jgi:hypothetical protein
MTVIVIALAMVQSGFQTDWGLLAAPGVRREIGLSPERAHEIDELLKTADQDRRKRISREARSWESILVGEIRGDLERIGEGLTPGQQRRLKEMTAQEYQWSVFIIPGVPDELGITKDQQLKIANGQNEARRRYDQAARRVVKTQGLKMGLGKGKQPIFPRVPAIEALWKTCEAQNWAALNSALTPQQRGRLDRLRGAPIDPKVMAWHWSAEGAR